MSLSWPKVYTMWTAILLGVAWFVAAFFMKSTVSGFIDLILFALFAVAVIVYFVQSWRSG
jgi:hypothetical protein